VVGEARRALGLGLGAVAGEARRALGLGLQR
jgi:hypothetical protein